MAFGCSPAGSTCRLDTLFPATDFRRSFLVSKEYRSTDYDSVPITPPALKSEHFSFLEATLSPRGPTARLATRKLNRDMAGMDTPKRVRQQRKATTNPRLAQIGLWGALERAMLVTRQMPCMPGARFAFTFATLPPTSHQGDQLASLQLLRLRLNYCAASKRECDTQLLVCYTEDQRPGSTNTASYNRPLHEQKSLQPTDQVRRLRPPSARCQTRGFNLAATGAWSIDSWKGPFSEIFSGAQEQKLAKQGYLERIT